ncbi:hypothetical protein PV-S19_0037 [Pacmanvirus S19]|nr:hypothetical protein PV-S19_0037 [Pacmanvirus S19]
MGNEFGRSCVNVGATIASISLAPVTGGASLFIMIPVAGRVIGENSINWRDTEVNNQVSRKFYEERVLNVEIRYCHIDKDWKDAGVTLGARTLGMTTAACHHWFIIAELESGQLIYIDKHWYRNILERDDRCGKNGGGTDWISSERLKCSSVERWRGNVRLEELICFVEREEHKRYHLLDDNCQDFAKRVFNWLKGDI